MYLKGFKKTLKDKALWSGLWTHVQTAVRMETEGARTHVSGMGATEGCKHQAPPYTPQLRRLSLPTRSQKMSTFWSLLL